MKKIWFFLLLALLAATRSPARDAPSLRDEPAYKLEKNDIMEQVCKLSPGPQGPAVKIDNVFGAITVSGHAGAEVRLKVKKRLRADSEEGLRKAESEVKLSVAEKDGLLDIYVDGPFRRHEGRHGRCDREYEARYDFEVQVPERCDLVLKTVTGGDITVRDVAGAFNVRNVNGRVALEGVTGSGSCQTVNGDVRAAFRRNPADPCSFKTVNGDVEVRFAPGLAADFKLKTFNGGVYSDLPVTYAPLPAAAPQREKGRFIYRSHGFQKVRVGGGGGEIILDTLNGDIVIAGSKAN